VTISPSSQGTEIPPQPNDGVDPTPKECIGGPGSETLPAGPEQAAADMRAQKPLAIDFSGAAREPGGRARWLKGPGKPVGASSKSRLFRPRTPITEVAGSESVPGRRATTFYT
jgi:hypothetical protein